MDQGGRSSMMAKMGDDISPYDLRHRDNQDGSSVVPITENSSTNVRTGDRDNDRRAMPAHYAPVDRTGQAVWRPGLPAPILCQNVTYGISDLFAESGRMDPEVVPQELPPRASFIDSVQTEQQQQAHFSRLLQSYRQGPHQEPVQQGPSMRTVVGNSHNSPNPPAGFVYNHQHGYFQHGSIRAPFQPVGSSNAAMQYNNVAYFQSVYCQGPAPNTHQYPTIPNQVMYSTPPLPPQNSRPMTPDVGFPQCGNMYMFPLVFNSYNFLHPLGYINQYQRPAQVIDRALTTVSARLESVDPAASGPVPLPSTLKQANQSASNKCIPGTRRRRSRATYSVLQQRAMCRDVTRPMGTSPSLNRSCEPVVEPQGYESVEKALAALNIGRNQQASPTRQLNADVGAELNDEKGRKKASGPTNDEPPSASAVVSSVVTRSTRTICELCKSNKETEEFYTGHNLKDELGVVTCPVLRQYVCSVCGATGDTAHTFKYCPLMKFPAERDREFEDGIGCFGGAAAAQAAAGKNGQYEMSHNAAGRCVTKKY